MSNSSCEHGRQNERSDANFVLRGRKQTSERPPWTCHCWVHEAGAGNLHHDDDDDDEGAYDDDDSDNNEDNGDYFSLGIQQIGSKQTKFPRNL